MQKGAEKLGEALHQRCSGTTGPGTLKEIAVDTDKVPQFTQWLKSSNIDTFLMMNWSKRLWLPKNNFYDRKKQAKNLISYLDIYPQGAMHSCPFCIG